MTRCTNCKTKWKANDVWSLLMQNDGKDCPYCYGRQYLSDDTFEFGAHALPFLFLFPFFVELSDTSPLLKFRKK
ncbi:hypothetical protein [Bacillus sp. XF8]|uniref:hypothetical protein n=1 Tax=Bacillus sp. XF8 TaxID=2819289 RepID=UPI001AA01F8F|nr:hypothetical protein [Bacillus sp. XF8]MBO1579967.1 hypothetical protein [Bacillus sp. XF8]